MSANNFESLNEVDRKHILAFPFEEVTAHRILTEAKANGIDLKRVAGEGLGDLGSFNNKYNGMKTPEFSNLVTLLQHFSFSHTVEQ